jgi:hypothetical protein
MIYPFRKVQRNKILRKGDKIHVEKWANLNKARQPLEVYVVVKICKKHAYVNGTGERNDVRGYIKFPKYYTEPFKPVKTWSGSYFYKVFRDTNKNN